MLMMICTDEEDLSLRSADEEDRSHILDLHSIIHENEYSAHSDQQDLNKVTSTAQGV